MWLICLRFLSDKIEDFREKQGINGNIITGKQKLTVRYKMNLNGRLDKWEERILNCITCQK